MKKIILASMSPRRAMLLEQMGLDFTVIPSNVDENNISEVVPSEIVEQLAQLKCFQVVNDLMHDGFDGIVIGADTIVVLDDRVLTKPIDEQDAFAILSSLQGRWHDVYTGICVVNCPEMEVVKCFVKTKVKMKKLSKEEILGYIKTGEPMDKAGAYGIQGKGAILVESIEGCFYNVVGLPIVKLYEILEKFGVKTLDIISGG